MGFMLEAFLSLLNHKKDKGAKKLTFISTPVYFHPHAKIFLHCRFCKYSKLKRPSLGNGMGYEHEKI